MSSKSELCLWCGRFTTLKSEIDGLAECDRQECIDKRVYDEDTYKWGDES